MSHKSAKQLRKLEQSGGVSPTEGSPQAGSPAMMARIERIEGPLPPPALLAEYERILPGAAREIMDMAKREQSFRHGYEKTAQSNSTWENIRMAALYFFGQFSGFALGVAGIAGGVYLVHSGKDITGFGVFFTSLATLVGAFIYQHRSGNKNDTTSVNSDGNDSEGSGA